MHAHEIANNIAWVGALDFERRLFDALIPLPEGTSYNAYLVRGSAKTALIDTVDPKLGSTLLARLDSAGITNLDYVVSNHSEQDHSGSLPMVLERFPNAKVITTGRGKKTLLDLMSLPADQIQEVEDGATLSLGDKTLKFMHFPWVHWPETMLTYVPEDQILFPCDLFGSHWARDVRLPVDFNHLLKTAKLYFAEIMLPFRKQISKGLAAVEALNLKLIAPSHGPLIRNPQEMLKAYSNWISDEVKNKVVIAHVSMHQSTQTMVEDLTDELAAKNILVERFDLTSFDAGALAVSAMEAATLIIGTPTVLNSAHPAAIAAAHLVALLKPKTRFVSVLSSFGWASKAPEAISATLEGLKAELLPPVTVKGQPNNESKAAIKRLAEIIAEKHAGLTN